MKELKAYIRIDRIDGVIHALRRAGITHMNVTHVQSIGGPIDLTEAKISVELASRYTNMVKLEIVCPETSIDKIISIIQQEAHTGRPGDGIIYVSPVDTAVKIRTGERDRDALV